MKKLALLKTIKLAVLKDPNKEYGIREASGQVK